MGFLKISRRDYNIIMPGSQKKIRINLALGKETLNFIEK